MNRSTNRYLLHSDTVGIQQTFPSLPIGQMIRRVMLAGCLALAGLQPGLAQTLVSQASLNYWNEEYILDGGDRLRVDLFNVPEYSGEYQVLSDGSLNLPLVGRVFVRGLTLPQASNLLSERYASSLTRPIVTLSLVEARPITVAIAGEVNRPGSYTVASNGTEGAPTVTQALQLAGGVTQAADVRQVRVRRTTPGYGGAQQTLTVNLWQLLQSGDLRQDLQLQDGDTILISSAPVGLNEARQLAGANFAASDQQPIQVAVVGEVNRPGPYTLSAESTQSNQTGVEQELPTVTKAIQTAGGITQSADIRSIQVRRMTRSGTSQVIEVNFWELLQSGDLQQDLPLQMGDTIVVPTATALSPSEVTELATTSFSPNQINVNVVGEVARAGVVEVPPNAPLNQALLAAGGFNSRAQRGTVELIRLNPDGTVSQREVEVDFSEGLNADNNIPLRPNDTLVVKRNGVANVSDTLSLLLSPITGVFSLFRLLGL